jgi:hypothetical protein
MAILATHTTCELFLYPKVYVPESLELSNYTIGFDLGFCLGNQEHVVYDPSLVHEFLKPAFGTEWRVMELYPIRQHFV